MRIDLRIRFLILGVIPDPCQGIRVLLSQLLGEILVLIDYIQTFTSFTVKYI